MKTWRTKQYQFRLSRYRTLTIKLRRFRTNKLQRSQRYRQYVVELQFAGIREIALYSNRTTKQTIRKRRQTSQQGRQSFWRWQTSLSFVLILGGLTGVLACGTQLVAARALVPAQTFTAPVIKKVPKLSPVLAKSVPTHITISSVNIDADISAVGTNADGSIQLPPVLSWQVGWYKYSPTPGERGPAVLVGHVDSYKNISVFWRLRYVKQGDIVQILRADGSTASFTISGLAQYDQQTFPTSTVYQNTADAELKIITCGGSFDEQTHSYSENTVVTATLITKA